MIKQSKINIGKIARLIPNIQAINSDLDEQENIFISSVVNSSSEVILFQRPISAVLNPTEIGKFCSAISNEITKSIRTCNSNFGNLVVSQCTHDWLLRSNRSSSNKNSSFTSALVLLY